nr:NlpC/P60 family protein [uncultured Peptostreptococcus sp.]
MKNNFRKILLKSLLAFVFSILMGATSISAYGSIYFDADNDLNQNFRQEELSVIKNNIALDSIGRSIDVNDIKIVGFTPRELTSDEICDIKTAYNATRSKGQWIQISGKWKYKNDGSYFENGWIKIDGGWYYFIDEIMQTGWIKDSGVWYYCMLSGKMVTDLYNVNGTNYFFRGNGAWVENKGEAMSLYAQTFVGKLPYVWGGESLINGADCSGFTKAIHNVFGITINRKSTAQANNGRHVDYSNLLPGDIAVYRTGGDSGHVVMYIGSERIVEMPSPGKKCQIRNLLPAYGSLIDYRRCW